MHPQQQQEDVVAYRAAFALADKVRQGGMPAAVPPTIALRRGELQHGAPLMEASSFYGMDVEYSTGWVVGGGLLFTAVGLAASAASNAAAKNRAERQARPQWRPLGMAPTVVTSRRLMVMINFRWSAWSLDEIVANQLDIPARTLIVTFQGEQPLMLRGPWAAWTGVVISSTTSGLPWPPGTVFPPLPQAQAQAPRPLEHQTGPQPLGRPAPAQGNPRPAPAQGNPAAAPPQPERVRVKPAAGHPPAQPALPAHPAAAAPVPPRPAVPPHGIASALPRPAVPPHAADSVPPRSTGIASVPPRPAVVPPHDAAARPQPGPGGNAPAQPATTTGLQKALRHPQYQLDPAVVEPAYEGEVLPPSARPGPPLPP